MRRIMSSAALALLALSATANAQRTSTRTAVSSNPSPEIGIDAAATFSLDDNDGGGNLIEIPARRIRMGFFVSPAFSIEPSLGLTSIGDDGGRVTVYSLGAGLLYHFSPRRQASQLYVRPFVDLRGVTASGDGGRDSDTSTLLGIGLGVKVPMRDRIASRFELNYQHTDGGNGIGLLAGLSFYTR